MKKTFILSFILAVTITTIQSAEQPKASPLMQRRSKSASDPLEALFISVAKDVSSALEEIKQKNIAMRFAEFSQPATPSIETITLYGLPIYFERHENFQVSITFAPQGGSFTPTKNSIDFNDKTGDANFDALKRNLPKDSEAPSKLLAAILAKKVRLYLEAIKTANLDQLSDADKIIELAAFHDLTRIAKIIKNITKYKKYDEKIFKDYEIELCKLQKPAEHALTSAGLSLLKSRSQDL